MIYFNKITETVSDIKSNGATIGTLSRLADTHYHIEIDYFDFVLPVKDKRLVKGVIEKTYAKITARRIREMKPLRRFKEFKIKEL